VPVILWDFHVAVSHAGSDVHEGEVLQRMLLHKVAVQACDFSDDGAFLASIGGQDDNSLIIWECATGRPVVATPAGNFAALAVAWCGGRSDKLVTAGQYHVRSWDFSFERRRCMPEDLKVGAVKRIFTCLAVDAEESIVYAGTSTGDVLSFNIDTGRFLATSSHRFSLGALSMCIPPVSNTLLVGTGEGALVKLSRKELKFVSAIEVMGGVTSIALGADSASAFVGTDTGNIYGIAVDGPVLESQLRGTAHSEPIVDVIFPAGTSELFLTAAGCEIRVWHALKRSELLRIRVPAIKVNAIAINKAGTLIVSGWDDGKIRAFRPESGKLEWMISDAHSGGVSALTLTNDARKCISGGADGRVRVWDLSSRSHTMLMSFKEHKKEVTSVRVSANDEEALSSSSDGSCCIWNLRRAVRSNAVFASTSFRNIQYHPDESQLLTCGSDRKVTYWDTTDCTAIRVMDASVDEVRCLARDFTRVAAPYLPLSLSQVNCVDIDRTGKAFVSGGNDRLVKLWLYDEGEILAVGTGHSGPISKCRISPDNRIIVTVGAEGAIFLWKMPQL
jgi:WD40 repeat protein